jgi:hypothetical protein
MKCFWVTDRVLRGIPVAREPKPHINIYGNRMGGEVLALDRALVDFIQRGPEVRLALTDANLIEERNRIVLARPLRAGSDRALVLLETSSGIGGVVDWSGSPGVKVLRKLKRHVRFHHDGEALEVVVMLDRNASIRLTRTGEGLDDGENDWTEAKLTWDGDALTMAVTRRLSPSPGGATRPRSPEVSLPLAS